MTREQLFRFFYIGVSVFLGYQILLILSPFYTGILGAIVLNLIFIPMHQRIHKALKPRPNLAAGISTLLVVVLLLIPLSIFTVLLLQELKAAYPALRQYSDMLEGWRAGEPFVQIEWVNRTLNKLQAVSNISEDDLRMFTVNMIDHLLNTLTDLGKALARNGFMFIVNMAVTAFTLFFLFRDGPGLFHKFRELIPMDEKHKESVFHQIYITVTAVVRGLFIVAFTQGMLAGVAYYIIGVRSPIILTFCTMLLALVPFIGTPGIWLPVAVYLLVKGMLGKGLFLLLWGTFVVSLVDNFLRPIIIGSGAKLPVLFLFFGLLGGLKMYGPKGLFLGPLVIALIYAFIRIYREEYPNLRNAPKP
jgi:predicted PurR-regulated permease PerM